MGVEGHQDVRDGGWVARKRWGTTAFDVPSVGASCDTLFLLVFLFSWLVLLKCLGTELVEWYFISSH